MDRRQQKTRKAIFEAFRSLLEKKRYDHITVQEIIDEADVGRSTFYAHFETKEMLLEAMCSDVFFHVFERDPCPWTGNGEGIEGKLAHILWHVRDSQNDLATVLLSSGGEVFMVYFKRHLRSLFESYAEDFACGVPKEYLLDQLSSGFAETVKWWGGQRFGETPEEVAEYFMKMYRKE